jgi:hypothetical protein
MIKQPIERLDTMPSSLYTQPFVRFRLIGDKQVKIESVETNSGGNLLMVPFSNAAGITIPVVYTSEWIVDADELGINENIKVGGILDEITWHYNYNYFIVAFADEFFKPRGFGLMATPYSSYTASAIGSKGGSVMLVNITKAYRFTIGARVRIINSVTIGSEVFNLGTIQAIESSTAITVKLDNNANWGSTIPSGAGVSVEQLDRFRPYYPNDSTQSTWFYYYRIIGMMQLNTSSPYNIWNIYSYPPRSVTIRRPNFWRQVFQSYIYTGGTTSTSLRIYDVYNYGRSDTLNNYTGNQYTGDEFTCRLRETKIVTIYRSALDASDQLYLYVKGYASSNAMHISGY